MIGWREEKKKNETNWNPIVFFVSRFKWKIRKRHFLNNHKRNANLLPAYLLLTSRFIQIQQCRLYLSSSLFLPMFPLFFSVFVVIEIFLRVLLFILYCTSNANQFYYWIFIISRWPILWSHFRWFQCFILLIVYVFFSPILFRTHLIYSTTHSIDAIW